MRRKKRIGDIYSVKLENGRKYFQYVANDSLQLNSDVIRVFKTLYSLHEEPTKLDIINQEVMLYTHCLINVGKKLKVWEYFDNSEEVGEDPKNLVFRDSWDYGTGKLSSKNWHVWHINDYDFKKIGWLRKKYRDAYVGVVYPPIGIMKLMNGEEFPPLYPSWE